MRAEPPWRPGGGIHRLTTSNATQEELSRAEERLSSRLASASAANTGSSFGGIWLRMGAHFAPQRCNYTQDRYRPRGAGRGAGAAQMCRQQRDDSGAHKLTRTLCLASEQLTLLFGFPALRPPSFEGEPVFFLQKNLTETKTKEKPAAQVGSWTPGRTFPSRICRPEGFIPARSDRSADKRKEDEILVNRSHFKSHFSSRCSCARGTAEADPRGPKHAGCCAAEFPSLAGTHVYTHLSPSVFMTDRASLLTRRPHTNLHTSRLTRSRPHALLLISRKPHFAHFFCFLPSQVPDAFEKQNRSSSQAEL